MKRLAIVAAALLSTGCASIFSGQTQAISLRTTPGAHYSITDSAGKQIASGTGQGTASLERGAGYFSPHTYQARISKPGYTTKTIDIQPGLNPWYFANILIGGAVGMIIVDPLTGAMFNLYPSNIEAPLEIATGLAAETQPAPASLKPTVQTTRVSRFEYTATQQAKAQGCRAETPPAFDGRTDPNEALIFTCQDGNKLAVICDSATGCR